MRWRADVGTTVRSSFHLHVSSTWAPVLLNLPNQEFAHFLELASWVTPIVLPYLFRRHHVCKYHLIVASAIGSAVPLQSHPGISCRPASLSNRAMECVTNGAVEQKLRLMLIKILTFVSFRALDIPLRRPLLPL